MKRFLFLLTVCAAVLGASASNRYISPTGDNGDGKSWAHAKTTIASCIWDVGAGDTMFIAEGIYKEQVSVQNGATYMGGYNAETGERDVELYETILDGTGMTEWIMVKFGGNADNTITIDGLVFQNANHSEWGGAAFYCRGGMVVSNCIFRNNISGSKAGGIFIDETSAGSTPLVPAVIRGCLFENCSCTLAQQAGAINCESSGGFIVENCIIRACQGGTMIETNEGAIIRNNVLYNNLVEYNAALHGKGTFINNTVCNNQGVEGRYGGCRIEGKAINNVLWGNVVANGSATNQNYIASGTGSTNNIADTGSGMTTGLAANNSDPNGPNFRNPTGFVGLPKTDVEKEAVKKADFSITSASAPLVDKGTADGAPAYDLKGVVRPKANGYDIGAYEYDPDEQIIPVTGVHIEPSSIEIIEGRTATLVAVVEPANASNKRVDWSIDNPAIASIQNGKVSGLTPGITIAHATTQDGNLVADAEVIIKEKPPVKYPQEVLDAEAAYKMEDYTIPSYIRFLVPKTAAKIDSLDPDNEDKLPTIALYLDTMRMMIDELQPKQMPYNQIATIYGDPATHMGFCWFTNGGIKEGKVQLVAKANATAEDFAGEGVIEVSAQTTDATLHYTPIQASESPKYDICTAAGLPRETMFDYVSHKAQATTLQPGTVYSWRVGFGEYWSEIAQFVTKDAQQRDYSFIYMTDSHIQDAEYIEQANRCAKAVAKHETDAKFCLFPGDFVDTGGKTNSEWQWERWFEGSMRPMLNAMTVVPTDGNHDDSPSLNYDLHFNTDWGFANGASVKPQFKGITYSFVYGDVLFLVYSMQDWWRESGTTESVMKSTYFTTDIRNWFKEQIEKYPDAKYRVTLSHKNVFSGAGHHEDDECTLLRTMMTPIMKECGIDLAIQGHDHCYEVMGPVNPDTWTVVPGSVKDTVRVAPEATGRWERSSNKTGLEGGTFTTDEGTLYFIGATCGRKRYEPYNRYVMDTSYVADMSNPKLYDNKHHNVKNLFDIFTSKFGQPGSPSYTRFNVTNEYLEMVTYYLDKNDEPQVYNTIRVKNGRHSWYEGIENIPIDKLDESKKFILDGQLYIKKNGMIYNVIGQKIAQ